MTPGIYDFVKRLRDEGHLKMPILEVGSLNVNGSVRDLFDRYWYFGIDRKPGPGVDRVLDVRKAARFLNPTKITETINGFSAYGTVLCLEVIEHDPNPFEVLEAIESLLYAGGRLVLTTRGIGYPLHDEPEDYWRFTVHGVRRLIESAHLEPISIEEVQDSPHGTGIYAFAEMC